MSKHTPGPWAVRRNGVIVGGEIFEYTNGSTQSQIAMACVVEEGNGEQIANALLIAAAPELLAALQEARNYLIWYHVNFPQQINTDDYEAMPRIDAVIRKATGGQP